MSPVDNSAKRRSIVVGWLNSLFPVLNIPIEASEEELREQLFDGTVLCGIMNWHDPSSVANQRGAYMPSEQRREKVGRFLSAVKGMGLTTFSENDLEEGSICAVVDCLLTLKDHLNSKLDEGGAHEIAFGNQTSMMPVMTKDYRGVVEALQEKTTSQHHGSHRFYEVFQLKQGRYSDIPTSKISEIINSHGLDNAPTQSLLSVIDGILDESNDVKNGELPRRVACLLRKNVQEIERRISTQAAYIRNVQTSVVEENKKLKQQHALDLMKVKENSDEIILELKKELERRTSTYEHHCRQLDAAAKKNEVGLQERLPEVEILLSESSKRINEVETLSESNSENCNKKEHAFHNFISFQLGSLKGLRTTSESMKVEIFNSQRKWREDIDNIGVRLKELIDAAENYHTVLAENRKLFNEIQELKGNIRVYCRVRPFLPGENAKLTTVDYIGKNGELVLVNPSRQGKDAHRLFKFNKVFGPTASQVQVFLDIRPLIRSVLDGYNVCIFAYGQTGSGKTYTMSGPDSPSEEEWGVNYRALNDLFHISQVRRNAYTFEVGVQMVEIYNEQIRDLLSSSGSQKRLGILSTSQPHGLTVPDASMIPVKSTSEVLGLMDIGQTNRAVSSTALNERSSRSHSILTVHVRGIDLKTGSISRGCLHLIDLSGSERVDRSEVVGHRLKETQHINKSLSALGDVISALSQKSGHVPYRNSKLTQILQSSLGGQAKTLMFVQVNPDGESYPETLSTLKFAERVSGVELGAAKSNKVGKEVKDLIEQVASLNDTIARKDDEIEKLQTTKDLRTRSPKSISLRQTSSPRVSASSPVTQEGGGKSVKFTEKNVPDAEIFSDISTRNLDVCSQLSMNGRNVDENSYVDDESGGYGDAER